MSGPANDAPSGEVCVVLPCAGAGVRFDAPYPKELHCIAAGTTVLDLSLAPFLDLAAQGWRLRLIAVLSTAKLATAGYLARFADRLTVVMTYQSPRHGPGLRGALAAATPLCTSDTVLVLPDQFCTWDPADNPIRSALHGLAQHRWAVLAAPVADPALLAGEGAVRVEAVGGAERVTAAAEKPADPAPYNAVWVCVAVTADAVARLPDVVGTATPHPLVGAAVVRVDGYRNVTTPGVAA
ncbi:MAG TPA: hypothetical protein VFE14_20760 [Micromonosporaceae bacterium]|jgi:hypothetical protein|nr:hypothetical protein [Micromonosporaceae bacterium]